MSFPTLTILLFYSTICSCVLIPFRWQTEEDETNFSNSGSYMSFRYGSESHVAPFTFTTTRLMSTSKATCTDTIAWDPTMWLQHSTDPGWELWPRDALPCIGVPSSSSPSLSLKPSSSTLQHAHGHPQDAPCWYGAADIKT